MNKMIKNTCILTVITLVAGCLLGLVYEVTKDADTQKTKEADKQAAYQKVLPEADYLRSICRFLTNNQLLLSFRMQDMMQISQK